MWLVSTPERLEQMWCGKYLPDPVYAFGVEDCSASGRCLPRVKTADCGSK